MIRRKKIMPYKFIFIGGLHRSGTSLIHELLSSHPEISGFSKTCVPENEGQHLQTVFKPAIAYGGPGHFCLNKDAYMDETHPLVSILSADKIFSEWEKHWNTNKTYLIEKSPPNIIRTRFLQSLFPESFFIIILRHPIAIAYATKKWTSKTSISNLIHNALTCYEKFYEDAAYLNNVHIIHYEQFVTDPQKQLDEITDKLGIDTLRVKQPVHTNVNEKYFQLYKQDQDHFFKHHFTSLKNIPKLYEKRLNKFGYSAMVPGVINV